MSKVPFDAARWDNGEAFNPRHCPIVHHLGHRTANIVRMLSWSNWFSHLDKVVALGLFTFIALPFFTKRFL